MTVLILTQPFDPTADLVVAELASRNVPVIRCDAAEFPQRMRIVAKFDGARWRGQLATEHRMAALADIRAVYYRRPTNFEFSDRMPAAERQWAEREARQGFGGVIGSLECRWLNRPWEIAAASAKPYQLRLAAECGLSCLPTVITNDPGAAGEFAARVGPVVYKPMSGPPETGQPLQLYTTRIAPSQLDHSVRRTAHLFQLAVLHKRYEVRVTVVGQRVFAARIDAASPQARADWRSDYPALSFRATDLPDQVTAGVRELTRRLGLRFGALDFIVDQDGRYRFLEINPNGQWAFVEQRTGLPITAAIADELQGGTP